MATVVSVQARFSFLQDPSRFSMSPSEPAGGYALSENSTLNITVTPVNSLPPTTDSRNGYPPYGPAFTLELGFKKSTLSWTGVTGHWMVYIRNRGKIIHDNDNSGVYRIDQAVHPKFAKVIFSGLGAGVPNQTILRDRLNIGVGYTEQPPGSGQFFGMRDMWQQEPSQIGTSTNSGNGFVTIHCLADRQPNTTMSYPPVYTIGAGIWQDTLAQTNHRLAGGRMKMWEVFQTTSAGLQCIESDPEPSSSSDWNAWAALARVGTTSQRALRPDRLKKVVESFYRFNGQTGCPTALDVGTVPNPADVANQRGYLWYHYHQDDLALYAGQGDQYYNLLTATGAYTTHWSSWFDPRWGVGGAIPGTGHYNNTYNWSLMVFRFWLEAKLDGDANKARVAWWIYQRLARWEATSAHVWGGSRVGWRWYETADASPTEAGSQQRPSVEKSWSESLFIANKVFPDFFWASECQALHTPALDAHAVSMASWDGWYGSRQPGWTAMNCMAAYRYGVTHPSGGSWKTRAISICDRVIDIMKQQMFLDLENFWRQTLEDETYPSQWASASLGVPYVVNQADSSAWYQQIKHWMDAKCCTAMVHVDKYSGDAPRYSTKILQMVDFFWSRVVWDDGAVYLTPYVTTPDRTVAFTRSGMTVSEAGYPIFANYEGALNVPSVVSSLAECWLEAIGYAGASLGHTRSRLELQSLWRDTAELIDWAPGDAGGGTPSPAFTHELSEGNLPACSTTGGYNTDHRYSPLYCWHPAPGSWVPISGYPVLNSSQMSSNLVENKATDRKTTITPNTALSRPDPSRVFNWANLGHKTTWVKNVVGQFFWGDTPAIHLSEMISGGGGSVPTIEADSFAVNPGIVGDSVLSSVSAVDSQTETQNPTILSLTGSQVEPTGFSSVVQDIEVLSSTLSSITQVESQAVCVDPSKIEDTSGATSAIDTTSAVLDPTLSGGSDTLSVQVLDRRHGYSQTCPSSIGGY